MSAAARVDASSTPVEAPLTPVAVDYAITTLASVLTVVLTAVAFWLSYEHLQEVAAAHGMAKAVARSWAWPATVDLFIVIGELLILRASLAHQVDWWAIGLVTAGDGASIGLNVAGVGQDAGALNYVVAAVPRLPRCSRSARSCGRSTPTSPAALRRASTSRRRASKHR